MNRLGITTRLVTTKECPWLEADVPVGTQVIEHDGPTYGVLTDSGIAVNIEGIQGFIELPIDSLSFEAYTLERVN